MPTISEHIQPGVIAAKDIHKIFKVAKKNNFAIPAVNCTNIDSINAALETASKVNSPIIIQFSYGGSAFMAGDGIKTKKKHEKAVIGAISGAQHVHIVAKYYNIPVILHTDHCHKELLPWIDELLNVGKKHFKNTGKPLFSSHMIDLSKEKIKDNINICSQYLKQIKNYNMMLEIELGCTGGEEDGVDNTHINAELLYTKPEDVNYAYEKLNSISPYFIIAASFGNVHGVYQTGNVQLKPIILKQSQDYLSQKHNLPFNPVNFVFHGGSGSDLTDIKKSIKYGVVKMNIDTDTQWASWEGILQFYKKNKDYLQKQLGNPKGKKNPNKRYYDPRVWMRASQMSISKRLEITFKELNACNSLNTSLK
ncbi:fructose-bisphosphate aldolase [Buchnera aphidicola (Nipponaphis monzeni)]|uniref:Fructose-bisphosphate aldolase n=1 Tax=Buchnera aphidicola (Nipponaphis monzeni) TaxID=2495405 RepID=A0A455TAJ1_9GAMM|nr:class II fructose-bisphosphate aldolase [Buchnera aphidicola]BBI01346.1 fructose-bisphosphate aldolase [Buchnera aphidicola (Nipponaphis monzeni)]